MSAYQYQLSDAKADRAIRIAAGACSNSADFVSLVNQAQRLLMKRGNWFGVTWLVKFCLRDACIVWPRYVGTVIGLRFCSSDASLMRNAYYAIIGPCTGWSGGVGYGDVVVRDNGTAPCHNEVMACTTGKLIRYVVTKRPDIGKTCKIFGTAYGGQPLQERDADGNWTDGITLTAADPYATTSVYVTRITAAPRQATQGMAWLYEYNPATDELRDLAAFEPNETHPRRRRSTIINWINAPGCKQADGSCIKSVEALVKLEFVPATNDNDFLMIDDFDALALAIKAIRRGEADEDAGRESGLLLAVKEMNLRERDKLPNDQTAVSVQAVGGCPIINPI